MATFVTTLKFTPQGITNSHETTKRAAAFKAAAKKLGVKVTEQLWTLGRFDGLLVFEAPDEEIPGLSELVRREMIGALDLSVPLKVDLFAGPNWLDVEAIPGPR